MNFTVPLDIMGTWNPFSIGVIVFIFLVGIAAVVLIFKFIDVAKVDTIDYLEEKQAGITTDMRGPGHDNPHGPAANGSHTCPWCHAEHNILDSDAFDAAVLEYLKTMYMGGKLPAPAPAEPEAKRSLMPMITAPRDGRKIDVLRRPSRFSGQTDRVSFRGVDGWRSYSEPNTPIKETDLMGWCYPPRAGDIPAIAEAGHREAERVLV